MSIEISTKIYVYSPLFGFGETFRVIIYHDDMVKSNITFYNCLNY